MSYNYPWSNLHDLNIDWLLKQVKQLAEAVKTIPRKTSQLINDAGFITAATFPVTSVNNKTGAVVLNASDVGALPNTYTPPVIKVNNRTGSITITDIMTRASNQAMAYPTTSGAWSVATNIFSNLTPASYYGILTIENNGNYQRHIFSNMSGQVFVGWTDNANITEPATWSDLSETSEDLYCCEYSVTTNAQIESALAANKIPVLLYSDTLYVFSRRVSATNHYFCAVHSTSTSSNYYYARCNNNAWSSGSGSLARLASPTFTGTPKAPTPAAADNSTQIATTAFVQQELAQTVDIEYENPAFNTVSVPSGTITNLTSFDLDPGTYIISVGIVWVSNATGVRRAWMASSPTGTYYASDCCATVNAVNGYGTPCSFTFTLQTNTSITRYINGFQNSGAALTATDCVLRILKIK